MLGPDPRYLDQARFLARVRREMFERDLSQEDLAEAIDMSQSFVSKLLREERPVSYNALLRLLDALAIDWNDVRERPGDGHAGPEDAAPRTDDPPHRQAAVVRVPRTGEVAAGNGIVNGSGIEPEYDAYPRQELTRLTNLPDAQLENLRTALVIGDSLAPEILPNSRVVYLPTAHYRGDGLYVLTVNDTEIVKLIQIRPSGTIIIRPINPRYDVTTLLPVEDSDTPNTYREQETNLITTVQLRGKVVAYLKPA